MVGILRVVYEERWRRADVENHHINVAVIVDVAEGHAAAGVHGAVVQTGDGGNLIEGAIALVAVEQERFAILDVFRDSVDVGIDVAAGDEQVGEAVIVKIDETSSPGNVGQRTLRDFGGIGEVGESLSALI